MDALSADRCCVRLFTRKVGASGDIHFLNKRARECGREKSRATSRFPYHDSATFAMFPVQRPLPSKGDRIIAHGVVPRSNRYGNWIEVNDLEVPDTLPAGERKKKS